MISSVIMSLTWRQSAWVKSPSETKRSAFFSSKSLASSVDFNNWLVGVTDGDGCFYFDKTAKNNWTFSFQVAQSSHNLRLLYAIKSALKIGTVTVTNNDFMAVYRVRNRKHLIKIILPIFDSYPLLTSKHFRYQLFKKALLIVDNPNLTLKEKDSIILNLKNQNSKLPEGYKSPVWDEIYHKQIIKKAWLVGFVEAKGSFSIVQKGPKRLVHAFEITQKLDPIILKAISEIFDSKVTTKETYLTFVTTNTTTIKKISDYFFKTMKGMKSLEYRIWARSFNKKKKDFEYLLKIRNLMRNIRSIKYNKNDRIIK